MSQTQIQLLNDKALWNMTPEAIETYKLRLAVAITDAGTELSRDHLRQRMDSANRILNNKLRSWR